MKRGLRIASAALALLGSLAPLRDAEANGRFPQANYLVLGPGRQNDLIVLRATFGLVISRDHGARWDWVCEEALDAVGSFDPSIALGSDQRVALGLPDGMRVSTPEHCAWTTPRDAAASVTDITQDAAGAVMFAAGTDYSGPAPTTRVYRSDDRGQSWRVTSQLPSYIVETVDVAPGDPRRIYLSGYRPGAVGTLMRSDDGGMTFQPTAARFPELASVWIAAVHPSTPNRMWLRVAAGLGTQLHRSDDGGASTVSVATTDDPMDGFAISDDGETVWYGTANRSAGIHRSVRGAAFTRVRASASVRCMRHHGGLLFVCGDEATDGYSLAWSADGGDTLNPLMSVRDIRGPLGGCAGDGGVSATCSAPWTLFSPQLRDLDAATSPVRVPLPTPDAGGIDAGGSDTGGIDAGGMDGPLDAVSADRGPIDAQTDHGDMDRAESPSGPPDVVPLRDDGLTPADLPTRDRPFADSPTVTADLGSPRPRSACDCGVTRAQPGPWGMTLALAALTGIRRRRRGARRR